MLRAFSCRVSMVFERVAGKGRLRVARVEREVRSRGKKSTLRAFS